MDQEQENPQAGNGAPAPALEIAHVLFMDIVAYSKMPMDVEQRVLGALQEIAQSTVEFRQAEAEHRLIRLPTGDGMALVFFGSPEMPVRCALELARTLKNHPEIPLPWAFTAGRCTALPISTPIATSPAAASTWRSG